MSWVKVDDRFPDHPKVKGISDAAFRAVIRAKCYACTYLTDGYLPPAFLETVPARVKKEIITARLWDEKDDAVWIHDFHDYQEDAETVTKRRKAARDRMKRVRNPVESSPDVHANGSQDVRENIVSGSHNVRENAIEPVRDTRPDPTRPVPVLRTDVPELSASEDALWASVVDYLQREKDFSPRTIREWFQPCEVLRRTEGLVEIRAPKTIIADYLVKHYRQSLNAAFEALAPGARWTVVVKPLATRV